MATVPTPVAGPAGESAAVAALAVDSAASARRAAAPDVDPAIGRARPLAGHWYVDAEVAVRERAAIFARSWQLACPAERLARPGDYVALEVAGEPVVLVRDGQALRGFYNVCRHRGGTLAEGCGRAARLTCRYHGWSYGLDGAPLRAPEMEVELAARSADLHLKRVRVDRWAGLVFVNLDPGAGPLTAHLGRLVDADVRYGLAAMRHVAAREYPVAANWKLYVDNYLEGYHLPAVHPRLNRELDFRAYVTEVGERFSYQHAPVAAGGEGRVYDAASAGGEAHYWWLFPNAMLNVYQGWLQTNLVEPRGVDACVVRFDWYALDPPGNPPGNPAGEARFTELLAFSEEIQAEDAAVCAALQRNAGTRGFDPGAYSTRWEAGVHRFHRLYAEWLAGAAAPGAPDR